MVSPFAESNGFCPSPDNSCAMVLISTTVGTPIAITGIPNVCWFTSFRLFCTPAPGAMPVLLICTVVPNLSILLEARASITTTAAGFVLSVKDKMISAVSIPVCPNTPGAMAAALRKPSNPILFAISEEICRVARV